MVSLGSPKSGQRRKQVWQELNERPDTQKRNLKNHIIILLAVKGLKVIFSGDGILNLEDC